MERLIWRDWVQVKQIFFDVQSAWWKIEKWDKKNDKNEPELYDQFGTRAFDETSQSIENID